MRAKIAGVVVAFAVLLGGGIFLAVDDEDPAQGVSGGSVSASCVSGDLTEATPCY